MGALHIERNRVLGPNGGRHSLVWGWDWQLRPSLQEAATPPLGLTTPSCFPRSYPCGPAQGSSAPWLGRAAGGAAPAKWGSGASELVQSQCVRGAAAARQSVPRTQAASNKQHQGRGQRAGSEVLPAVATGLATYSPPRDLGQREAAAGADSGPHVLGCGCWCDLLPGNGQGQSGKGRQEGLRGASLPFPEAALTPWWVPAIAHASSAWRAHAYCFTTVQSGQDVVVLVARPSPVLTGRALSRVHSGSEAVD
ncbi:unnamed protein product [Lepidochelys olivacea]